MSPSLTEAKGSPGQLGAGLPLDSIEQGIPMCLFLEKTVSVLSYFFGIFHSYLASSLGKVGLRVLQIVAERLHQICELISLEVDGAPACQPTSFPSLLPTDWKPCG